MSLRLAEALDICNRPTEGEPSASVNLLCGFTPLHLATFVRAYAGLRLPGRNIQWNTGVYGSLQDSLERVAGGDTLMVLEWTDLDRRLGMREAGGWHSGVQTDILDSCERSLSRLRDALRSASEHGVVTIAPPGLPLPPIGHTVAAQQSRFESRLMAVLYSFLDDVSQSPSMRVLSEQRMGHASPPAGRIDIKSVLVSDFPYTLAHASALAEALVDVAFPVLPKKGLITDLDDTLWQGILGEVGVDGVRWDLPGIPRQHAMYQQFLALLARNGVLLGIASKNDADRVSQALDRGDLLVSRSSFFPVEAHWESKSSSVDRILAAWNVGPESVVFVDDSPMEAAEVQSRFPGITCLEFPRKDPNGVWRLLHTLRDLFGKPDIGEEDALRALSLRNYESIRSGAASESADRFLESLAARISVVYSRDTADVRAFELTNKTNQFNLNGVRYTSGEWMSLLREPGAVLATVSYEDKFGALGKIAALAGKICGSKLIVRSWVMSCRAFSRRIEFVLLQSLFGRFGLEEIEFEYQATARNQPLQELLAQLLEEQPRDGRIHLDRARFERGRPALPHTLIEVDHESNRGSDSRAAEELFLKSVS